MKAYLIRLTAAAILAAILRRLAPSGGGGKAVELAAGLLVLLTAFGPATNLDTLDAVEHLSWQQPENSLTEEALRENTNLLLSGLICDEAEAYILDKARSLGTEITAEVTAREENGQTVPYNVVIKGSFSSLQRLELSEFIAEELGIPKERQEWWNM